jgi:hypothetical protein
MKKLIKISVINIIFIYSCNTNQKIIEIKKNESFEGISLDAKHNTNNEFKLVYNSVDTISTTLIINKKTIEKTKIKSVLDTLKMQNYIINVDKQKRIIELISK